MNLNENIMYNNLIKHTKRYLLRFYCWWEDYLDKYFIKTSLKIHVSDEEFDTKSDLYDAAKLYEEIYKDTPRPIKISEHYVNKISGATKNSLGWRDNQKDWKHIKEHIDYFNGTAKYWGYVLIDFEEEKILGVFHDKRSPWLNWKNDLGLLDRLFRKPNEIPDDYKWDEGEYTGWLQFRWGNGLNAIEIEDRLNAEKQKSKNSSKKSTLAKPELNESEEIENKFDKITEKEEKTRKLNRW